MTALLVPGAIITALLQSGSKALAPQWPGLALVAAGSAVVLLAAAGTRHVLHRLASDDLWPDALARYAPPPNQLGLCGPADNAALPGYARRVWRAPT